VSGAFAVRYAVQEPNLLLGRGIRLNKKYATTIDLCC